MTKSKSAKRWQASKEKPRKATGKPNILKLPKPSKTRAPTKPQPGFLEKSKLSTVISMLRSAKGATIEELSKVTGWQGHSVRGAISGAIKKKLALTVTSVKNDGVRTYRINP
jgi:Protein of unknown function (DUF3489)